MPAGQDDLARRPDRPARIRAPRRRRGLRIAAWTVAAVVVLVAGGVAILAASFDPNSLKPRIVAAVRQATGRNLALTGDIGLKWSLQPTVAVRGVSLSNPPGFSRGGMATLQGTRFAAGALAPAQQAGGDRAPGAGPTRHKAGNQRAGSAELALYTRTSARTRRCGTAGGTAAGREVRGCVSARATCGWIPGR